MSESDRAEKAEDEVRRLQGEVQRLRAGHLTPDEFQELCQNLHTRGAPCTREEFEQGCRIFQDVLFGAEEAKPVCQHEWVSARNAVVLSGEICAKCHILRREG